MLTIRPSNRSDSLVGAHRLFKPPTRVGLKCTQLRRAKWGESKMGAFPHLSRNVPFCPRLSSFVPTCPRSRPQEGQKRTSVDKTGHFGTNGETPPFRIYPHLALLNTGVRGSCCPLRAESCVNVCMSLRSTQVKQTSPTRKVWQPLCLQTVQEQKAAPYSTLCGCTELAVRSQDQGLQFG